MPLYNWRCEHCKQEIDVLRAFADYEQEPQPEELPEASDRACTHKWNRVVNPVKTIKGIGWGAGKGSW